MWDSKTKKRLQVQHLIFEAKIAPTYIYVYIYIFNIMLTWKIVEVSEVSVLYKCIDDLFLYQMIIN